MLTFLFDCRQLDRRGREAHRSLQHRGRGGPHRHQDIRRYHELPGERDRGDQEGKYNLILEKYLNFFFMCTKIIFSAPKD